MNLVLDIYARVSRLGDDRQRSTAGQVDDCKVRVEERGGTVGEVHVDSGRSAWNPRVRRPHWERLMERLESGATGGVVVFDMARFSRRPIEGERLIVAAERGLLVLDSEGEYDLTTANGRKGFRDQLNAAAYESDRLSTRVKRGKRVKAAKGEPNHSWRPFGFEPDGVTIRDAEAEILREVTARVLDGENQDRIVVDLNDRGIRTSTGRLWSRESFKQLLLRPRNAGYVDHLGEVVSRLPADPIIDEKTWVRLTTLFEARRRGRPNSPTYLASGWVLCGRCRHALTGRARKHLNPYPDGSVRRQYWCQPRARNGGCGRLCVDQREFDRHLGAMVVAILSDPQHASAVEAAARAVEDARRPLANELSECEQLADELSGRLGRGEINLARYDAATGPLDRRIAELRRQLAEMDADPTGDIATTVAAASVEEWAQRWEAATVTERRILCRQAFGNQRVVVKPAKLNQRPKFDPERIVLEDPEKP